MKRIGTIFEAAPKQKVEPTEPAKDKRKGKGKKEEKPCTPITNTTEKSTGES